jgi:putative ABC transport system ATP-binding protein
MPDALRLQNVKFRWRATDQLTLDIPELVVAGGERLFISGASGSGKSTLLNLIGGVLLPEEGDIVVGDTNITGLSAQSRDQFRATYLGMIFQMFNLMPFLSILENVMLPCRFSDDRRSRAELQGGAVREEALRLLSHMGLDANHIGDRGVAQLSIGQQQRVAAARALLGAPKFIIADEPTSSLDSDSRHAFLDLLFAETQSAGSSVLFVSHDSSLARSFDRTVSLNQINLASGLS